ncbi:hypothetical protein ACHHYP_10126 [Achlya hypogyna]|uniref:Uncharacterized protein n=1 Tax=Achlya hypogyna TaxID=1202772 RepID=A0A1V9ZI59_ACHHY|nr:hypothetical protein ACHHYP_10126 [Achlya hypogyna]
MIVPFHESPDEETESSSCGSSPVRKPSRRRRVLSKEQLELNRARSRKYYARNRDVVLAKLRAQYVENREKERDRQRDKYLRNKARKLELKRQAEAAAASPLSLAFILN